MKKYIVLLICMVMLTGCFSKHIAVDRKIDKAQTTLVESKDIRLGKIGEMSYATDIALQSSNVPIAKITNDRVIALADKPTLENMKLMQEMVSELSSNNVYILNRYDKDLTKLQDTISKTQQKLDDATALRLEQGKKDAQELSEYKSWFGLGGLFKSLKSIFLWLVLFGVIFFILRIASAGNPIASSIFGIFRGIGSMFVKGIQGLVPNAIEGAGYVVNTYKNTTNKFVDTVETIKVQEKASGKPYTTQELLDLLSKAMSDDEKKLVKSTKEELKW